MLSQLAGMFGGSSELSHRERVWLAVNGELVDRPPVCFWHHFQPAGSGNQLARQTLDFFVDTYDLDIVKVMPDLPYPFPRRSIRSIDDWRLIEPIDARRSPWIEQQVLTVETVLGELILPTPIVVTMFSPLTEAIHVAQSTEQFLEHLQQNPALVHQALSVIAENQRTAAHRLIDAGADGLFFALQGASTAVMPEATYREIGLPYDLAALRGAQNGWLNILHLHGERDLMFDLALGYPVQVINWSDRIAGPSLRDARMKTGLCLMGGWNEQGAIASATEQDILAEALDAKDQTNGLKFILSPGCSIPDDTTPDRMAAARDAVDSLVSEEFYPATEGDG